MLRQSKRHADPESRIIALVCVYLDIPVRRIRSGAYDRQTTESRRLLCFVLQCAGYRTAHISRIVGQSYATVYKAVKHVERQPTLRVTGRRLAEAILPIAWGESGVAPISDLQLKMLCHTFMRGLLGTVSLRDMRAIRAYVCGTLLGHQRVPAVQAIWGLWILSCYPEARLVVDDALTNWGLQPYCGLIDLQLHRVGMRGHSAPSILRRTSGEGP